MKGRTVLALPDALAPYCSDKSLDIGESGKLELA